MPHFKYAALFIYSLLLGISVSAAINNFVIVIPSYNNKKWYEQNLRSALSQNYPHFRIIYTDDCSCDGTGELVEAYLAQNDHDHKVCLIKNDTRRGALHNFYTMIHMTDDDDIIVVLDGDDWLPDNNVLTRLSNIYSSGEIWLTYGQFKMHPSGIHGWASPMPHDVVANNDFRNFQHIPTHLRTFYSWLFKKINLEDLLYEGDFYPMTCDMATMYPMIEMAGERHKFVPEIMYIYNDQNSISDHHINKQLQSHLDQVIRKKDRYKRLERKPLHIGLCIVATGRYITFVQPLLDSAEKYFCPTDKKTYFIFTDASESDLRPLSDSPYKDKIVLLFQKRLGWPYDTLMRFSIYDFYKDFFAATDYMFATDADMLFVDIEKDEILHDRVATQHPGFEKNRPLWGGEPPYDRNPNSTAYIPHNLGNHYFAGGFYGGKTSEFIRMITTLTHNILTDLEQHKYIALWHDESHLNRYFIDNIPSIILDRSYCYPENGQQKGYPACSPKLLALDKDHSAMRE